MICSIMILYYTVTYSNLLSVALCVATQLFASYHCMFVQGMPTAAVHVGQGTSHMLDK